MKTKALTLLFLLFTIWSGFAQAPALLNYQAALRNVDGMNLNNELVLVGFEIRQGDPEGFVVYEEEHSTTTNDFGLVNVKIGNGTNTIGTFGDIDWAAGPYFLLVEVDGSPLGTQELTSVPYSIYATEAGTAIDDFDKDPNNELQTLSLDGSTLSLSNAGGSVDLPNAVSHWSESGPNLIADNPGNVGIGMQTPLQKLHVRGRVRADFFQEEDSINKWIEIGHGGSNGFINMNGNSGSGRMDFRHNDMTQLSITEDGRVGIGTENPEEILHVNGNIRVLDDADIFGLDMIVGVDDLRFFGDFNTDEHPDFMILPNGRAGFRMINDIAGVTMQALPGELITLRVQDATGSPLFQVSGEGNAGLNQWWDNVSMNVRGLEGDPWYFTVENPNGAELFAVTSNNNVSVTNNLSKGGGSFKIDHPLDPENQFLYHSFVESPDMMNIYNGNVVTDASGFATVTLPDYFTALNKEYRYQLTVIGGFAQAIVKEKVADNKFVIQTNEPSIEVSWQVTGIRQDPYANENRIPNTVDKAPEERGLYLHPSAYGQPAEKGLGSLKQGQDDIK